MPKRKRVAKKGYVYLLYFYDGEWHNFKYGCSSVSVKRRVYFANRWLKKQGITGEFEIVAVYESKDIFDDENQIAYRIIDGGFGRLSEYIGAPDEEKDNIITNFHKFFSGRREVSSEVV